MTRAPVFFDAHTHAQFAAYDADRSEVIRRALGAGVWMVNVGTQKDTSRKAVELAEQYPEGVYAAVGLHPIHTEKSFHDADELGASGDAKGLAPLEVSPGSTAGTAAAPKQGGLLTGFTSRGEAFSAEAYLELAKHPKTVAIGECGLDYYHLGEETKVRQREAFAAQIDLAKEVKKPLMVHCREAFPDLIALLTANRLKLNAMPGIIHFFCGTADDAKALLDLGFSFTFGGAITFPPRKGQTEGSYDAAVRLIPLDRILSETDAPYVAPVPYRGKRNEPAYIVEVVKRLAALKGFAPEEMAERIFENAKRLFPAIGAKNG